MTIKELLNPGDEVLAAWGRAYGVLADVFIQREEAIYQETEQLEGGWRDTRAFRISAIEEQSAVIKSFTLTPVDGGAVAAFKPGQYITVPLHPAGFAFQQNRQYSLTHTPNGKTDSIAVKHDAQGTVSGWLHQNAKVGDVFMDVTPDTPVALISAGVGVTPTLAMLHTRWQNKAIRHQ